MQLKSTIIDDLAGNLDSSKINTRLFHEADLYNGMNTFTSLEELFESIEGPCVYDFFTDDELNLINKIIRDHKDKSFKKKFQKLDAIVKPKGFKRSGCGTNRVVYEPLNDNATFCIKIALDKAGSKNNPDEIVNQKYLKPFVAKCFDISQDGNVGIFERVIPIENLYQLWSVREDIYKIMETIVGRFIIDDFGTKAFKNWGLRKGFGPVLLDYADMYILDPKLLYCTHTLNLNTTEQCRGELDYDAGFNNIICLKCGGIHMASEFKDGRKKISVFTRKKEMKMKDLEIVIYKDGEIYWDNNHGLYTNEVKNNTPVKNKVDIVSKLEISDIEEKKKNLITVQSKSKDNEDKYQEFKKNRVSDIDEKNEIKKDSEPITITVPAVNPAPVRINKYFAPKPERPARDLKNTMHNNALSELKESVNNNNDKDTKVEINKEYNMNTISTREEIKSIGKFIRDAADEIKSLVGTDDEFSYNEILSLCEKLYNINKIKSGSIVKLEEILPDEFYAFIDSDVKKDKEISIDAFRLFLDIDLLYALNTILDIKLDIESNFEDENREKQPRVRCKSKNAKISERY